MNRVLPPLGFAKHATTHEGAPAEDLKPFDRLKRSVLACLLWEDTFYESGVEIATRIFDLVKECNPDEVLKLAVDAHLKHQLRHAPLWLIVALLKHGKKPKGFAKAIASICSRPDQMIELLSLYWLKGKCPIAYALKEGLRLAFIKFNSYQLSKYQQTKRQISLRDVMFLVRPKPPTPELEKTYKQLADRTLEAAVTWDTKLSTGGDKKESFTELLEQGKMGKLAILMNVRNMQESGVDQELVKKELLKSSRPMLPFKFIQAARACPAWEPIVDQAMIASMQGLKKLKGKTIVLVDVSGSMNCPLSIKKNEYSKLPSLTRLDAACGIAILLREIVEEGAILSFSDHVAIIPPRQGMALGDAIRTSQAHSGTRLGAALSLIRPPYDRIIVITDEQSSDAIPVLSGKKYIINVAPYRNGIEHKGNWLVVNGFSEAVIDYIKEVEEENQ